MVANVLNMTVMFDTSLFNYQFYSAMHFFISPYTDDAVGTILLTEDFDLGSDFQNLLPQRIPVKRKAPFIPKPKQPAKCVSFPKLADDAAPMIATEFTQKPADFVETIQSLETGVKMYQCKFCGIQKPSKGNLSTHVLYCHLENVPMVKCTICEYESKLKGDMKKHYISRHNLPEDLAKLAVS